MIRTLLQSRPSAVRIPFALCAALLGTSAICSAQTPTWVRTWDGARPGVTAPPRDSATGVLADAAGNVYVLGMSLSNANTPVPPPLPPIPGRFLSHDDLAVVKLSPDGNVVWSLTYDFPTLGDSNVTPQTQSGHDAPLEGVLGTDGSLYVLAQMAYRYDTGTVNVGNPPQPTETTIPAYGLGIVKISPSGSVVWSTIYFPSSRVTSMNPISMALGDSGRLYAAYSAITPSNGQTQGVLVVDSTAGTTVTDLMLNAAGASAFTLPRVVRPGTGGRVYVASTPPTSSGSSALLSVIDDATVSIVRETFAPGPVSRGIVGMVVSPVDGSVAISGDVNGAGGGDAMATKFTAAGDHLWTSTFDDINSSSQSAAAGVAMDAAGNVYTAGIQGISPAQNDVFVVKFPSAGGAPAWGTVWSRTSTSPEWVTPRQGIVVRPSGEVLVSGWLLRTASGSDFDMLALALNADTGAVITPIIYNPALSTASDDRVSGGMLLTPDGGLVLAGRSFTSRNMDFVVVKFGGGASACNAADITGIGGPPAGPDRLLTGDDFNAFISAFAADDLLADITGVGGPPATPDGLLTGDDFNAFISAFAAGCP
ncbi:MAG: GC-type dockerin domain-anchored protein [bacterium]